MFKEFNVFNLQGDNQGGHPLLHATHFLGISPVK